MKHRSWVWSESYAASVKKAAILAISSDTELSKELLLKGGNALEIAFKISTRASMDLDYSIDGRIEDITATTARLKRLFEDSLGELSLAPIEFTLQERPPELSPELRDFWGGYRLTFKIVRMDDLRAFATNIATLKSKALPYEGPAGKQTFQIDISCHEYCESSVVVDIDGYPVLVYSPQAMICEKLRAICQQNPKYGPIVKREHIRSGRARDFVDIYELTQKFGVDPKESGNRRLLQNVFAAKRVPLDFLHDIAESESLHESDFARVVATVRPGTTLLPFNDYFLHVCQFCKKLESFWHI